jgi:hypothetical protein
MIDKSKTYRTRDGREVRIYATDGVMPRPIHGAVKSSYATEWHLHEWYEDGRTERNTLAFNMYDLIEVRPRHKRTVWLNVHVNRSVIAHNSREEADNLFCKDVAPRLACIKVELDFAEGDGL